LALHHLWDDGKVWRGWSLRGVGHFPSLLLTSDFYFGRSGDSDTSLIRRPFSRQTFESSCGLRFSLGGKVTYIGYWYGLPNLTAFCKEFISRHENTAQKEQKDQNNHVRTPS
jgi:hypothetical protein